MNRELKRYFAERSGRLKLFDEATDWCFFLFQVFIFFCFGVFLFNYRKNYGGFAASPLLFGAFPFLGVLGAFPSIL